VLRKNLKKERPNEKVKEMHKDDFFKLKRSLERERENERERNG